MLKEVYETERLLLRLSHPDLAAAVTDFFVRNREFFAATEPQHPDEFYTEAYHGETLENQQNEQQAGTAARFWVSKKSQPDRIIGMLGLSNIVMRSFCSCYLSYSIDGGELCHGYATEAIRECIRIAFRDLSLHRLEANIMPRNTASLRVAEKLGFVNEGLAKKYLRINGIWEDHIHMVLINDDL